MYHTERNSPGPACSASRPPLPTWTARQALQSGRHLKGYLKEFLIILISRILELLELLELLEKLKVFFKFRVQEFKLEENLQFF